VSETTRPPCTGLPGVGNLGIPVTGDGVEVIDVGEASRQSEGVAAEREDDGPLVQIVTDAVLVVAGGLRGVSVGGGRGE